MWSWLASLALGFLWSFFSAFVSNYSKTFGTDQEPIKVVAQFVADAETRFAGPGTGEAKYTYVFAAASTTLAKLGKPIAESLLNALIEAAVQTVNTQGVGGLLASAGIPAVAK